jgi:hypothetical protein
MPGLGRVLLTLTEVECRRPRQLIIENSRSLLSTLTVTTNGVAHMPDTFLKLNIS